MHAVLSGVVFVVLVAAVSAQLIRVTGYNFTKSHRTEDYITQNVRQYAASIKRVEAQLEEIKASYNSRIDTVAYQKKLVELKIDELEMELNSLESINEFNKYCVQKYRSLIATVDSVQQSFRSCVTTGASYLKTILAAPEATVRSLKLLQSAYVPQYLENCLKQNTNSRMNYTLCVTNEIKTATEILSRDMKNFNNQIKQAICSSARYVEITADCSFNIVYSTVSAIGEAMRLIEHCIEGTDSNTCPTCPEIPTDCAQHSMTADDFQNATIANPLVGLESDVKCLQINVA